MDLTPHDELHHPYGTHWRDGEVVIRAEDFARRVITRLQASGVQCEASQVEDEGYRIRFQPDSHEDVEKSFRAVRKGET